MKRREGSPSVFKQLLVLLLTVYLALGAPFAQAVSAATWHVDAATGNDANDCTSAGTACKSITGALGKSWTAGDTVEVHPGLYNGATGESFPLNTADLSLQCADQAGRTCIIDGIGSTAATIHIYGDQTVPARVEGFTIKADDGYLPIFIWAYGGDTQTPVINNNTITANNNNGIYASASTSGTAVLSPTITGNTITASTDPAVYVWAYVYGGGFVTSSPTITGNTITSTTDDAIYFYGFATSSSSRAIFNADISNNTLNAGGNGLNIRLMSEYSWPDTEFKPTISGNTIASSGSNGIYIWVYSAESSTMDFSPVISNNTITNPSGHGIYIWFTDCCTFTMTGSPVISGNTITGGGGDGINIYFMLDSANTTEFAGTIENNTISNNSGNGIEIMAYGYYAWWGWYRSNVNFSTTISHNTITDNAANGLYMYSNQYSGHSINPTISFNTITGNGENAIYLYQNTGYGILIPDLGGGASSSPGYNTIVGNTGSGYDDILNNGGSDIFAMNNWFTQPASISGSNAVNLSEQDWTLSFTGPATATKGGAIIFTAAAGSGFVTDVGASHTPATVMIGGVAATVFSADGETLIAKVPNGAISPASVTITNPAGQSGTMTGTITISEPSGVALGLDLISPADGATGLDPASIDFSWSGIQGDGPVVYLLYVCTDPTFETCSPANIDVVASSTAAGMGGLGLVMMGLALAGGMSRRRKIALLLAVMLLVSVSLIGCGNTGGGDVIAGSSDSGTSSMGATVTGLDAGTTYYWKVVAYTADGTYESYTYSFTTL